MFRIWDYRLFLGKGEIYGYSFVCTHGYLLLPGLGLRKDGPLNPALGQDIEGGFRSHDLPALVPGYELVFTWWDACQFEPSAFVGHGVIRMGYHQNLCIHPRVTAIASHVRQTCSRHGPVR